ncbi:BTB domain-containing protein [Favolaschia claudopus]|uniref:BTB domain-containing protein n=1 Tax=Favolaschia claudopus TaxID=2862362 RepID=A0AAW0BB93_9AGAR
MSSPPTERRIESLVPVTRSEIWHTDGSVILQSNCTQFRVHWSVLAMHSGFFNGMLGLPQPPDQPNVDGCPIIELCDDSEEDVACLLRALYDPLFFVQKTLPMQHIASILRLSRKYEFRGVLETVAERLTHENPTTLAAYDALKTGNSYSPTRIVNYHGLLYDTINVAGENKLLSILPCAYYRALVGSLPTDIFDGIPRSDGTLATLAPVHQRACNLGRVALLRAQWESDGTFGWTEDEPGEFGCTESTGCREKKYSFFRRHVVRGSLAPFCSVSYVDSLNLCAMCTISVKARMISGRQRMWDLLPTFFDLPAWSELKDEL